MPNAINEIAKETVIAKARAVIQAVEESKPNWVVLGMALADLNVAIRTYDDTAAGYADALMGHAKSQG